MAERLADPPRRMQHVGGDDGVVGARLEPLGDRRAFDVEDAEARERVALGKARAAMGNETRRHIGVVVCQAAGEAVERTEHVTARAAGAGADFENADVTHPVRDQRFRHPGDGLGGQAIEVIGPGGAVIDARDQVHGAAGKDDVGSGPGPGQHVTQRAGAAVEQLDMGLERRRLDQKGSAAPSRLDLRIAVRQCRVERSHGKRIGQPAVPRQPGLDRAAGRRGITGEQRLGIAIEQAEGIAHSASVPARRNVSRSATIRPTMPRLAL